MVWLASLATVGTVLGLCITIAGTAAAQDSTRVQRPISDTLAPVTIRVLRTPFVTSRAPFAVAVILTRDATTARPGLALDELFTRTPGIQADNRLNFALGERIAIRGLGARSQFGVRGIRVLIDDIPATLADGQTTLNNVDLASLQGAEVLRGPASALYGNASGGVIRLTSTPPPSVPFRPSFLLMAGSHGLRRAQLGGGGTYGHFGYVISGTRLDYDGFRDSSRARNTHLNAVVTHEGNRTQTKLIVNAERHNAKNPGSLSDSLLQVDRRQAFRTNVAQQTGEIGKQIQFGVSTNVNLWGGELRVAPYLLKRTLDNPIPPAIIAVHRTAGGLRAAFAKSLTQTRGAARRTFTMIAGIESDHQNDDRQNYENQAGLRGQLTLDQRERITSLAPFTQLTAVLGPLDILGGLRYDRFRFHANDDWVTSTNPDDSGVRTMSAVSSSLGVSYTVSRDVALYANTATAFQTPTTTELVNRPDGAGGFNPSLQPEHIRSIEAGLRATVAARIAAHVTVYHMRISDRLSPFELEASSGRQFYRNIGSARHRGIESDLTVIVNSLLSMRTSYTYTDAKVTSDTAAASIANPLRVAGVVPHLFTFAIDITGHPQSRFDRWFTSLELRAQSRTPVNDQNTVESPGYVVLNLRTNVPVGFRIALFGGIGNLLNARYNTSIVVNAAGGRYFEPAAESTMYLGLRTEL